MARVHRLTTIECGSEAEMRGMERLLGKSCGWVSGIWPGRRYSGGWAVDGHWQQDGWVKEQGLGVLQLMLAAVQWLGRVCIACRNWWIDRLRGGMCCRW